MKNVLITGGSRGIGAACVRTFIKNGFRVFFTYKENDAAARELEKETGAIAIKADVSKPEDMKSAADILHSYGTADIIVNNAGISQIKMFQDIFLIQ